MEVDDGDEVGHHDPLLASNEMPTTLNTRRELSYHFPPDVASFEVKCPPNTYQVLGKSGVSLFFTNPGDTAAWYVNKQNNDDISFACSRTNKKSDEFDKTWGMLQPELDWTFPFGANDRFERKGKQKVTRAASVFATRSPTHLNGLMLQKDVPNDQPSLSGTLLSDVDQQILPQFELAQRLTTSERMATESAPPPSSMPSA
jgi:hypothetical protein